MVLPRPSDTRGDAEALRTPKRVCNPHDSWGGTADGAPAQVAGRKSVCAGIQVHPLSFTPTKMLHFLCPGEDSIAGMEVSIRDELDPPRQLHVP